jgi:FKBP-type peptidyl-prolyl cis-trans isomerase
MMASMQDTSNTAKFEKPEAFIDSVSYLMGAGGGKALLTSFESAGLDTIIDLGLYLEGFSASAHGEELRLATEENMGMVNAFFKDFQERQMAAQFGVVKKEGEEYLAKNGALSEVTVTASGLQYEIIKEGNGPKPTFANQVKVHYHGTLVNGEVFDSSVERGEPATFGVGQVIRGWTEALQIMPVGSKWKLTIPSELAYGTQAPRGSSIKPYSVLIFEVELLEIVK